MTSPAPDSRETSLSHLDSRSTSADARVGRQREGKALEPRPSTAAALPGPSGSSRIHATQVFGPTEPKYRAASEAGFPHPVWPGAGAIRETGCQPIPLLVDQSGRRCRAQGPCATSWFPRVRYDARGRERSRLRQSRSRLLKAAAGVRKGKRLRRARFRVGEVAGATLEELGIDRWLGDTPAGVGDRLCQLVDFAGAERLGTTLRPQGSGKQTIQRWLPRSRRWG